MNFMIAMAIKTLVGFLRGKDKKHTAIAKWGKGLIPLRDLLNELYPDD